MARIFTEGREAVDGGVTGRAFGSLQRYRVSAGSADPTGFTADEQLQGTELAILLRPDIGARFPGGCAR